MSKDYWGLAGEDAETAYLAGVIDVLSDNLSMVCDYAHTLDADVFRVPDSDITLLNDAVKKRMLAYHEKYGGDHVTEEKICGMDLQLRRCEIKTDLEQILIGALGFCSSKKELPEAVHEFVTSLNWYLQKPVCIYDPVRLPDKSIHILGDIYIGMAFVYFFIMYEKFAVLIIIGSAE